MTRICTLALLGAATILSTPLSAAPADAPSPAFTGRDLFDLSAASDPQISPDGRFVAYVRRSADIMTDKARSSIWLITLATGEQRPIAAGTGDSFSPRWSPDGRRLAYASTAEGGAPQLFVRWMDGGQAVRVTGLPDSPQALAWSPDGKRIAYLMNVPDEGMKLGKAPDKPEGATWAKPLEVIDKVTYRFDGAGYIKPGFDKIFMVDADGGAPRQLTFGAYHDGAPEWTADGRAILFSAVRKPDWEMVVVDSEIYRLDLASGAVTALTTRDGPDAAPEASPDGRTIAYLGFDDHKKGFEQSNIYVMGANGGAPREIAPEPRPQRPADRMGAGRSLALRRLRGGRLGDRVADRARRQRPPDRARRRRRGLRPALCRRRIQRLEGRDRGLHRQLLRPPDRRRGVERRRRAAAD